MKGERIKKILITSDAIGGVWNFSIDLCKYLSKEDISVIIALTGEPLTSEQKKEVSNLPNVTLQYKNYKLEWMPDSLSDIEHSIKWIAYLVHLFRPDVLHFNSFSFAAGNFDLPIVLTAHSDVYSWYDAVKNSRPHIEWDNYYSNVKEGLGKADVVTAPSNNMKEYIERFYGTKNIKVIYNGRDSKLFSRRKKENYILSNGRIWDEAKNHKVLIEAASELMIPVLIAGEYKSNDLYNLPPNVTLLGKLSNEEIAKYLSKALLYVHTAKYEPFGLAPLEAGLSKCALVLNDISSLREIWGDNALFFSNKNELISIINELLSNEQLLKTYSEKAYNKALEYSLDRMGANYLYIYKQLSKESVFL
ncbi:MAG: glycosyltransferase family 4 protein [Syntrophothermus sp.]